MSWSLIILFAYFLIWLITFILYQKKRKYIDAGSILLLSVLIYSIFSFFLFKNYFYEHNFKQITIIPFIYLYGMLLLSFAPVLRYNSKNVKSIQSPTKWFFYLICIVFIISNFLSIPNIIFNINRLFSLLNNSTTGIELYDEVISHSESIGRGGISNFPSIIAGLYRNIGVLLFFYYLTKEKRKKFLTFCLFIAAIISIFTFLLMGQRGGVFYKTITLIITYFLLRQQFSPKINKVIKWCGIIFLLLLLIPIIALTFSRFGENGSDSVKSSLLYYLGQQNLYFNNYAFDNGGIRYGDRTFPFFKMLLGFENVPHNFIERRAKYPNLHINDEVFCTYVGDFIFDFGPIIAFLIFLIFSLYALNHTKIRNEEIKFHQLILLHFIICLCCQGSLSLYTYADIGGNLNLIFTLLLYIAFKFDYDMQRHNNNLKKYFKNM